MRYRYFNPNPLSKSVGDCAIRAVAVATGQSWDDAFDGVTARAKRMADMPSSDAAWGAYLRRMGFRRYAIPNTCPDCYTAGEFAADHPRGVYVLVFGGHVSTIRNGYIYDTWDSSDLVPVYYYFKDI